MRNLINRSKFNYFAFYKPFNVLSQFTSAEGKATLSGFDFPKDCYSVGRLDYDSEGLLIISDDSSLNNKLLNPRNSHSRSYFAQVEGTPSSQDIAKLSEGVVINISGKPYKTKQAKAELIDIAPNLPDRYPPIRFRKNIPTGWIKLTLTEGKNRQVRKMTASIGFPTLRLVRYSIEDLTIVGFQSGEIRRLSQKEIYKLLKI